MLRSEELMASIEDKKAEIVNLKEEGKLDEALNLVEEVKNLKKEYQIELELENKNKEEFKMVNNEVKTRILNEEEVAFVNYCKAGITNDLKAGTNGALVPNSIATEIIKKVEEKAPLFERATKFMVKGDLTFVRENTAPVAEYMDEMADGVSSDPVFTTVKLGGFVARALTLVSRSLINKTDIMILDYVINAVAEAIARFLEKELINGTTNKIKGLSVVQPTSVTKIDADALIELQIAVPTTLQANAEFLVNPAELKAIRKLKDGNGQYIFCNDMKMEGGYNLLGHNILVSDQVPAGTVFYGDFSGLYVKMEQDVEIQVLNERFAERHAIGVVGFVQVDANVVEAQKISAIKIAG